MRFIFISPFYTFILSFILWGSLQFGIALICQKIPEGFFSESSFLFKARKWEKDGKIYVKIFRVNRWKEALPDAASFIKAGYEKKRIKKYDKESLDRFLIESRRAELTHIIAILPFWIFGFFTPPFVVLFMFVYAVSFNLPFIIVQRYNRPRIEIILTRLSSRQ